MVLNLFCKTENDCERMKQVLLREFGDFVRITDAVEISDMVEDIYCLSCNVPDSTAPEDLTSIAEPGMKAYLTPGYLK